MSQWRAWSSVAAALALIACAGSREEVPSTSLTSATAAAEVRPSASGNADAAAVTAPDASATSSVPVSVTKPPSADAAADPALLERKLIEALDRLALPVPLRRDARGRFVRLHGDTLWEPGGWNLGPGALPLEDVAAALRGPGEFEVTVQAFTDSLGSPKVNDEVSQRRADAVRDFLVAHGVLADHVRSEGMGARRPIADNATPDGRAENRRLEIVIATPVP